MSTLAAFVNEVTFFEIGMSLIVVGVIEQIVVRLPADMVGPGGWLLDTGAQQ